MSKKNPKRVAAGKQVVEHKRAREKMLEEIAVANAAAVKATAIADDASSKANEAINALKNHTPPNGSKNQIILFIVLGRLGL